MADTSEEVFRKLQQILSQLDLEKRSPSGEKTFDAYVRTFICGRFGDLMYPPDENTPSFEAGRTVMKMAASAAWTFGDTQPLEPFDKMTRKYLQHMRHWAEGRVLFSGGDGYVGYAPASAKPGDEVCVILGCGTPMALRPLGNGRFLVIGECFVPGINYGEALLGLLPPNLQYVRIGDAEIDGSCYFRLLDLSTGSISSKDPRLDKHLATIKVGPDILQWQGVNIAYFDLV
jgi:hypothetical protein